MIGYLKSVVSIISKYCLKFGSQRFVNRVCFWNAVVTVGGGNYTVTHDFKYPLVLVNSVIYRTILILDFVNMDQYTESITPTRTKKVVKITCAKNQKGPPPTKKR